jgi:hypothetical protein
MRHQDTLPTTGTRRPACAAARAIGRIYTDAPLAVKVRLLDHLLRPLSAFAILFVANGAFGRIWLRHGWREFRIDAADVARIDADAVIALAEHLHVQQHPSIAEVPALLAAGTAVRSTPFIRLTSPCLPNRDALDPASRSPTPLTAGRS